MQTEIENTNGRFGGVPLPDAAQNGIERRGGDRPPAMGENGKLQLRSLVDLPVQLDVRVPVPRFRVSDLLSLEPGKIVASEWPGSEDLPLSCGGVQLVWSEFEVVDQTLAVRVTRLV